MSARRDMRAAVSGGSPRAGRTARTLGVILIAAAILLAGFNVWDGMRAESAADEALSDLQSLMPIDDALPAASSERELPGAEVDGERYVGVLRIPALGLELPVAAECDDARLAVSPCRYAGTPYAGDLVIAAHNYPAHFGHIDELAEGAEVSFEDVDGEVFAYRVDVVEALEAGAVEEMTAGEWPLTLFTCTIDGASRTTVRCQPA